MSRNFCIICISVILSSFNGLAQQNDGMIRIAGAMKNVMWKGELDAVIKFDTLNGISGLYGLGPLEGLRGEVLIVDGKPYVSKVISSSSMSVEINSTAGAPFFVYGVQVNWRQLKVPTGLHNIRALEDFIEKQAQSVGRQPFIFKLTGKVAKADIHIQNLPPGSKVSSPKEAHQGQTNYIIEQEDVEVIGFYSTMHKAVFTHHDTNMHLHLITKDRRKMGHLDEIDLGNVDFTLYLPAR